MWVACWACQRYHHLCLSQQATSYMGFYKKLKNVSWISRTKEMLFQAGMFWVRRIFLVF